MHAPAAPFLLPLPQVPRVRKSLTLGALALVVSAGLAAVTDLRTAAGDPPAPAAPEAPAADAEAATSSRACGVCHPAIYAEHRQNTHGAAFHDEEARLATRDFTRENCVRCHTPRPVYETGLGMVPIERRFDLEEGNTCMSCHGQAGYDYARFRGGAECKVAFDERVGTVEACATCHRIAGTPEQWEHAREGKLAGRVCMDCHMPLVERPVAVGAPSRSVRSHVFPASRSEEQLHRAYAYDARIEGDEVVVTVRNVGAGHNFPTATVQRSLESVVVVRDAQGREVATDRAVFKHPYARPGSLELPQSTQIPSGGAREHRVAIPVGAGTVECELLFKLYYPIGDGHPTLSRRLEWRTLRFAAVVPTPHPSTRAAPALARLPAVSPEEAARPDALAKFAHPAPGTGVVPIPPAESAADVAQLVALLEFPVPGARVRARARLVEIGARAVPALVEAMGHWSDETRDQAVELLVEIGEPAVAALRAARTSDRLYVRYHARMVLSRMALADADRAAVRDGLVADLSAAHPLDRRSAADALARLGDASSTKALRALLAYPDPDVVASAAGALARLDDREAVPAMRQAFAQARFVETRRDLAGALASLGSSAGVAMLLEGLDHPDDVIRRSLFATFFAATGLHASYDPDAPRPERLEALARLQSAWAQAGGDAAVRRAAVDDPAAEARAWRMVEGLGGGTDTLSGGDDLALLDGLVRMGGGAVPALVRGLTFPSGFVAKRALVCEVLGRIADPRAAPALVRALRDPDLSVASWACWSLASTGDAAALPALRRWSRRLAALADAHADAGAPEPLGRLLARAAWIRSRFGDEQAGRELEACGGPTDEVATAPPTRAIRLIATAEATPVPAPTSPDDAVEKGRSLRAQDFYEDAVRVLEDADEQFGPTPDVRLETAWNLLMIGEEDVTRDAPQEKVDAEVALARRAFDEALRMDPHVAGQDLLLAKLLRYEGANVQARMVLNGLVERDPGDANAHREFADFAYTNGDWVTAEREYSALARLQPADGWPVLYATIARQWLERPAAELEAGYLQAARMLPEEPLPLERMATLHAASPGRNAALLERVIADRPEAVEARVVLARLLAAVDAAGATRAEALLREAIGIAPSAVAPHLGLARMLAASGRVAEAVGQDLDAIAVADQMGAAQAVAGLLGLLRANVAPGALPGEVRQRAFEAVTLAEPASAAPAHEAGLWYLDVGGDPATALRFLERASTRAPDDEAVRRDVLRARAAAGGGK